MKPKFTTFCVVIQKRINGYTCPLPKDSCMWNHRQTGVCTYNEQFAISDFTVNEYAERVGLPPADSQVVNIMRNSLAARIKLELVS